MSTKTTFKRVALVAVAALGLGVVSSVAPASAATVYTTAISVTTSAAPVAGATGTTVTHTVRFSTATTAAVAIYPRAILTSTPASSLMASRADAQTALAAGTYELSSATAFDGTNGDMNVNGGTVNTVAAASDTRYTYSQGYAYLHARYDVAGTYVWTIWDDATTATGAVNGLETSTTFTVVVGATGSTASYTATSSAYNTTSVVDGANGALVKISLTSGGAAASPDLAGGVRVTVTGTGDIAKVNNNPVTATTTFILGSGDFNGSGNAWVNITNATAQVVTVTLSGTGSMASSFTAPAPVVLTFTAEIASAAATIINKGSLTGLLQATADKATIGADGTATANKAGTSALTFQTTKSDATAAALDAVTVTDGTGAPITGAASGYAYDILVASGDSDVCTTYCGTFTVTPAWTSTIVGQTFEVADMTTGFGTTVTSATAAATTATVTSADVIRSVYGGTHSFTVNVDDQFGLNMSNVAVSAAIAGRNSTVNVASAISNASGNAVLTYTDASTSTTSLVDTLTFTAASGVTDTASVTYTSLAGLGVSTVLATTSQTSATTGADLTTITPFAIAAGSDGVEAGRQTVTITVKDANAVGIAGVPVTVTVAGAGAAIYSTTQTVYTSATGVATASVYAWLAPTYGTNYVVTATAGGVSDTVNTYWGQANGDHTRNFTATAAGRVITVVAKDRLGNPVLGAAFTARITAGDGFFGTGTNIATGTTDATGTLKFVTLESPTTLTVVVQGGNPASATYAQTDAPAGNISTADAADTFTAATAGTATTAETGVGATFAPAGNNTASVTVEPSVTAAEVAADAAAEATDAANAATDAANAAAEAADAATAAAQDAADAVAALATSVEAMVSALKKQITSLTNLVIKIQKKVKA
jgi:hypothetical protein